MASVWRFGLQERGIYLVKYAGRTVKVKDMIIFNPVL